MVHIVPYWCVGYRNKTAEEMTDDIVNNQIVELKKLIDEKKLHVNDIDVFCEKGKAVFFMPLCLMIE